MTARDQSDAVALAVDNPGWPSPTARGNPFENETWVKNVISSGSIIPPSGEGSAVRRTDYLVGCLVLCLIACGVVGVCVALFWKG